MVKKTAKKKDTAGSPSILRGTVLCVAFFFLGFFLSGLGPIFALATPGESSDPLVSQSWVDNYIDQKFDALAAELSELSDRVDNLTDKHIMLYIGNATALINNTSVTMDVPPTLINGFTMLPLRFTGEALGITINWDNTNKKVVCSGGSTKVILPLGGTQATINGKSYAMPAAPALQKGRILVPARFISEAFSCRVDWYGKEQRIEIY